jgi:hypothetical protein
MTINGPAPMLLGFHECCIDQQCELYIENELEKELRKNQTNLYRKGIEQTISR